jgi:hypothetical protein
MGFVKILLLATGIADERAAAFAMGIAQQTKQPAVLMHIWFCITELLSCDC